MFHRKRFVVVAVLTALVTIPWLGTDSARGQNAADPRLAAARQVLDEATADVMAGRLAEAQIKLLAVRQSGVELGWFDQERLDRQLKLIEQRRNDPSFQAESQALTRPMAGSALAQAGDEPPAVAQPAEDMPEATSDDAPTESGEAAADEAAGAEAASEAPAVAEAAPSNDLLIAVQKLRSQEVLLEGRQAQAQGQLELAAERYRRAIAIDPENAEARAALAGLEFEQVQPQGPAGPLDVLGTQNQLRRQAATAEFNELMADARAALNQGRYAAATELTTQARNVIDRAANTFPAEELTRLREQSSAMLASIQQAQLQATQQEIERAQKVAELDAERARIRAIRERDEEVQRLLRRAADLRREQKYDESLQLVNQALFIDPTNVAAMAMKEMIEDSRLIVEYARLDRERNLKRAALTNQNLEALIPYPELLIYPDEWPEITQRRLADLDSMGADSEQNRRVAQQLRQPVPVNFEANKLSNVIDYLRNTTGVNFFVNWPALETAGVEKDLPITLQLNNIPAEQALRLVLSQASQVNEFEPVGYSIIEGIVTISTERDLTKTTDTRVYDIRDLLVQVPNFSNAPEFDLNESLSNTNSGGSNQGGGGSGQGTSLFGDDEDETDLEEPTRAELIEQITTLIQDTVGRQEDWAALGGNVSSVRELNGNLIIKTTPANHREIIALLAQLRETRAIQIAVEARFLLVDQNFLNEVGLDVDVQVNNLGGNFGPLTIAQDTIGIAGAGSTGLPGSFGNRETAAPGPFVPGLGFASTGRSLDIGISYLDDIQVNVILQATQASRKSFSLTAPRVTFFNGQRAFVIVARQIAFVSDLEPVPDAFGFDPTLSVTNSGVVLDVEGTISADRRYVTLTVRPSLATVTTPIRSIGIVATTLGANNNNNNNNLGGDGLLTGFIEAPELELTSIRATVSVPDRGTLLLGGQRLAADVEVESGVPVLSKVPVLNRLFTNTSTIKDERTLLILIRPTIIIQAEEEENLFPGLQQNPQQYGVGSRIQ